MELVSETKWEEIWDGDLFLENAVLPDTERYERRRLCGHLTLIRQPHVLQKETPTRSTFLHSTLPPELLSLNLAFGASDAESKSQTPSVPHRRCYLKMASRACQF